MSGRFPLYHTRRVRETVLFLFPSAGGLAHRPLLFMLTGLIAGILLNPVGLQSALATGILFGLTACGWLIVPRRPLLAALIPLFALTGTWLMAPWALRPNPSPEFFIAPHTLTGRIEQIQLHDQDLKCTLRDVHFTGEPGLALPFSAVRLRVKGGQTLPAAEGMQLTVTCRLRPFTNFNNPGRFDYKAHMERKGIAAWAVVKTAEVSLRPATAGHGWQTTLHHARRHIETALFAHAPTPRAGALLSALITGNRSHISQPLRDLFAHTGTAHLLAISGLHLGIVATLFFFLFKHLFSFWERPLIKGYTQILTASATLVPVVLYALLSGLAPSTQRALIAVVLVMGALAFHEEADLPTTLALAALVILAFHPPALFALSFQLSFAAVSAILTSLYQLRPSQKGRPPRPLRYRVLLFIVPPWMASLGTAPLVWYHFGYASPVGLIANLVMVPLASFAVVLPGLLGALFLPLCGPLAGVLFLLAGTAAEGSIRMATLFATLPGGFLVLPRPSLATTLLVLCLLFSLLLSQPLKRKGPAGVALLCLLWLGWTAGNAFHQRHHNPTLRVTVLDVGQGTSVVLAFPNGKRWLVDGGFAWPGRYDVGRFAVGPYLQTAQVTALDAVVLTHPESDHMGGLIHILKYFNVAKLITNSQRGKGALWDQFCDAATDCGTKRLYFNAETPSMLVEGVRVTCLHPALPSACFTGKGAANNNSLVLQLAYGNHRILLTGDIMSKAEARLVAEAKETLQSDVIIVPHHGSSSSSTPDFLARVRPAIAVVSVGQTNRYGLPHKKVLNRYTQSGCTLYRTDRHGAVTIESDGISLSVITALNPLPALSPSLAWAQP
ncbi:DNA internalization-related competence protein ComEC/Rec2 [Desulfoluna sp.]|uniref:DNA internalization-related competence protein ComEC/Rec2 n=1 Tax=Desulfoluna sp. TaxID=2045199 RepID=UPI00262ED1AF|nr:DNA internalization-related competence protein ComEC/Rec2 [Desulfoluna sp.]